MRHELRPLARALSLRPEGPRRDGLLSGAVGRLELVAATAGIGPRAAARTTERVLDSTRVDHVVVVGIAGGIGAGIGIGDLVVPSLVLDLESGAEHVPCPLGEAPPRGTLATSGELLVDRGEIARLRERGIVAIDMETAAIAAVCERRGCAWSVFRAISDRAGDVAIDSDVLALAGADGRADPAALARFLLTRPWRAPELVRLGRGMRLAANAAASAAVRALETM
jgi:nucleoside phosphorylase